MKYFLPFRLFKPAILILIVMALFLIPQNNQLTYGYGESSVIVSGSTNPPICGNEKPDQVVLYQPNHALLPRATGAGEVRLNWLKTPKANKYTIGYGVASGNYIYGVADTGNTDNYTIRYLTPGRTYYFVVRGVNDCKPGNWSREWSVRVGGTATQTYVPPTFVSPTITPRRTAPVITASPTPTVVRPLTNPSVSPTTRPVIPFPSPTPPPQSFWQWLMGLFGR